MRSFGIFYRGKCNKHTDYPLPRIINCHCNCTHQKTSLTVAAKSPQSRCIKMVLWSSCSPNPNGTYALMFCNDKKKKSTVAYVLKPWRMKHGMVTASAAFPSYRLGRVLISVILQDLLYLEDLLTILSGLG